MDMPLSLILGFVATVLVIAGYLPHSVHLIQGTLHSRHQHPRLSRSGALRHFS
jgi:hypothetical protein